MKKVLARLVRQSPAMIVAMLALFVALTGTAVATTSALITGKQIKNSSITGADIKNKSIGVADLASKARGARGVRGVRGVAGPPGAAGAQGAQGAQGIQGPPGAPNPNAVNSDLLDGKDSTAFAASVLGAGQLLTGSYAAWGSTTGYLADNVQFRVPLPADIPNANAHFISDSSAFTANCPGYGQALAGHACIYERTHGGRTFGSIHQSEGGITPGVGKNGFWVWFSAGAGGSWSYGEWAVRAPNALAAASGGQVEVEAPPGN